jgi:hypothetical protein
MANNNKKSTKTISLVVVAIVITTLTVASLNTSGALLSIASAQSKPDNVLGTIAIVYRTEKMENLHG